jgi:hypothetical protein
VLDDAIAQIPTRYRRDVLVTVDGAGASHGLVDHITTLNSKPGRRVHYSVGWELGGRERAAIGQVLATAWDQVLDHDGDPRPLAEAAVVELTALLRQHPDGDQLKSWPADLRIICRREKPHPGAQLSLFEQLDGWRYQLFATNTPATTPGSGRAARSWAWPSSSVATSRSPSLGSARHHTMGIPSRVVTR